MAERTPSLTRARTLLLWGVVTALLIPLYLTVRSIIMNEIRSQAMGVAVAVAGIIDAADLNAIREPQDRETPAFKRVQGIITRVSNSSADIRYIYTMRLAPGADPSSGRYEYVVDQEESDDDKSGRIDMDEQSEPVGQPYDGSHLPEMIAAWNRPAADHGVTPDPPYPDLLSGYAPVRDASGRTVAIVGADITAATIRGKLLALKIVFATTLLAAGGLIHALVFVLLRQRDLKVEREEIRQELKRARANVMTLSGLMPICASCKKVRNDQGYWEKLESYIAEHSDAELSHGLCPDCSHKLYPDVEV